MLEVGWFSTKLLFKGKLLENPAYFLRGVAIGTAIGFLLLVGLQEWSGNIGLAIAISSLITGSLMPFLLKDVRMK